MRYGIIVVIRMNKIGSSSVVHRLKIRLAALAVLLLISSAGSLLLYSFVMALTGFAALSLHVFGGVMIDTNVFDMVSLAAFASGASLGLASFIWMSKGALQSTLSTRKHSRPHAKRMKESVRPRANGFSIPVR
jgi:hypothetical protein